jgi:hypothetical protein
MIGKKISSAEANGTKRVSCAIFLSNNLWTMVEQVITVWEQHHLMHSVQRIKKIQNKNIGKVLYLWNRGKF